MPTPTKSQKAGRRIVRKPSQKKSTIKRQKLSPPQLEDLPNEVLLNMLSFLDLSDLHRFGQVSERLKSISLDFWQKIVINNDTVSIKVMNNILYRGCKYLCLKRCRITGATYLQDQIDNLELYQWDFANGTLETLMSSSQSLKKFSLTNYTKYNLFHHNLHTFYSQNGQTLQTLNLAFTCVR